MDRIYTACSANLIIEIWSASHILWMLEERAQWVCLAEISGPPVDDYASAGPCRWGQIVYQRRKICRRGLPVFYLSSSFRQLGLQHVQGTAAGQLSERGTQAQKARISLLFRCYNITQMSREGQSLTQKQGQLTSSSNRGWITRRFQGSS